MSKEMTIIALGIWIIVVPYLGVPTSWRTVILLITGFGIVMVGFMLRKEALSRASDLQSPHYDRKEGINSLN